MTIPTDSPSTVMSIGARNVAVWLRQHNQHNAHRTHCHPANERNVTTQTNSPTTIPTPAAIRQSTQGIRAAATPVATNSAATIDFTETRIMTKHPASGARYLDASIDIRLLPAAHLDHHENNRYQCCGYHI